MRLLILSDNGLRGVALGPAGKGRGLSSGVWK